MNRNYLLPAYLYVGPFKYAIITDNDAINAKQLSINNQFAGCADHDELAIYVKSDMPLAFVQDTLLHELRHCVNHAVGIDGCTELTQEDYISRTNALFLGTLQDNPEVVEFMTLKED